MDRGREHCASGSLRQPGQAHCRSACRPGRTGRRASAASAGRRSQRPAAGHHVVHVGVLAEAVALRQRVVAESTAGLEFKTRVTAVLREFGRSDKSSVLMRASGQHVQNILSAHDGEQEGLGVAIQRRQKDPTAGLDQRSAGTHDRGRVWYMLDHLHAGDDIKARGLFLGQLFHRDLAVFDADSAGLQRMQFSNPQGLGRQVDAQDLGTGACHCIAEDATTAADIDHALARQRTALFDPRQPQWVDLVQGLEVALWVPPAVGQLAEFGEFLRVGVDRHDMLKMKKPRRRAGGALRTAPEGARAYLLRVPTTSISVRRFLARPSPVLLSATGCLAPLPSV
mmetsp:Transcript_70446/g.165985  ORF Transcript_70446/g.165985 Transcript_70446/m.165985 type:complete len:339 (+) Transcript_70446:1508-2524(+)